MEHTTKQQIVDFEKQYNKIKYQKTLSVKRVKQLKYEKSKQLISNKEFNRAIRKETRLRIELNKAVRDIHPNSKKTDKVKPIVVSKPVKFTFPKQERTQSNGERLVEKYLKRNDIPYEAEKQFEDMLGVSNTHKLCLDFYLPEHYIAIEFDGEQHYDPSYYITDTLYKRAWDNDRKKDFYCQTKGIKMIRVRYHEMSKIDEILDIEIE